MQVIVGLIYLATLVVGLSFAIGGLGLGTAIVIVLFLIAAAELAHAKREETQFDRHEHSNAHGGSH
jgi:hypothetical protein